MERERTRLEQIAGQARSHADRLRSETVAFCVREASLKDLETLSEQREAEIEGKNAELQRRLEEQAQQLDEAQRAFEYRQKEARSATARMQAALGSREQSAAAVTEPNKRPWVALRSMRNDMASSWYARPSAPVTSAAAAASSSTRRASNTATFASVAGSALP